MSRRSERTFKRHTIRNGDGELVANIFGLSGPEGATSFNISRFAHPEVIDTSLIEALGLKQSPDGDWWYGSDLGRHHRFRPEQDWWSRQESCIVLDGAECWYDGTSIGAMDLFKHFTEAGWDELLVRSVLQNVYEAEFGDGD